jgi:TatD DNase family protein
MGIVDTHCHLQDSAFDEDRDAVIERALTALDWLVVVGDDLESSRLALAMTRDRLYASVGVHPYHAEAVDGLAVDALRAFAGHAHVVALGEIGLDYHYGKVEPAIQQDALRAQLDLACELSLPVVIHNRDSHEDMAVVLDEYHERLPGGIMHCFSGDPAFVQQCIGWGFHISFAGNVTFPKAGVLRNAAKATPLDRLLVETDSPYLAPQPVRGKRCEPAFVRHTLDCVAELHGLPAETLAEQTTANAHRLFNIAGCGIP